MEEGIRRVGEIGFSSYSLPSLTKPKNTLKKEADCLVAIIRALKPLVLHSFLCHNRMNIHISFSVSLFLVLLATPLSLLLSLIGGIIITNFWEPNTNDLRSEDALVQDVQQHNVA